MMRLWNLLREYLCCCWKPRSAVDEDADAAKKAKFAEEKSASGPSSQQQQQPGKDEAHVEDHQDEDHESEEEDEDHSKETFIVDSTTGDNDYEDEDEEEEKDVKKGDVFTAKDVAAASADQHHRSGSFEVSRNSSVSFSSQQQQQQQQQPLTACAQQQAWSPPTWYPSPSRFLSVEAPPAQLLSEPFTLPPISPILMDQEPSTAATATTQKIANRGLIKRVHAVGPEVFKQQQQQQQQQSTPKPKRRRIETEDDDDVHDDHSATAATTAAAAEHLLFSPTSNNNSTEASLSAVNTAAISPGTICPRGDKEDEDGDDDEDDEDEVYSDVILG